MAIYSDLMERFLIRHVSGCERTNCKFEPFGLTLADLYYGMGYFYRYGEATTMRAEVFRGHPVYLGNVLSDASFVTEDNMVQVMQQREHGQAEDLSRSISWLEKAVALKHVDSLYLLAVSLRGRSPLDHERSVQLMREACLAGSRDAWSVSSSYLPRDEYIHWSLRAVEEGMESAMFNLGAAYQEEGNYAEALRLYHAAADKGDVGSLCNIGYFHEYGLLGPKDYPAAFSYYMKAALAGNSCAAYNVANFLDQHFEGVPHDAEEALKWFNVAILAGPETQFARDAEYRLQLRQRVFHQMLFVRARERAIEFMSGLK